MRADPSVGPRKTVRLRRHMPYTTTFLWRRLGVLLVLAAAISVASLIAGGSGIGFREALGGLFGGADQTARAVMMEVRLPRLLAGFGVGSLLALAGVLLQAL